MRKITCSILLLCSVMFAIAGASETLTLEQAIQTALQRNPEILLAQKELAAAMGKRLQMTAVADPMLVFRDEGLALNKAKDGSFEKEYSLGLEQNLEFPGKRVLRGEIGRIGEDLAALALDKARLLLGARVKKAYYQAVLSRRTLESLDQASSLLDRFMENLVIKYQAGDASYSDVLRAKVEKARLQNQIIEERRAATAYRAELNILLGNKGDDAAALVTDIAFVPLQKELTAIKEEIRTSSPTLKMLAAKLRQSEAGRRLAKKGGLPDFSLGLYFPSLRSGAWGFSVGLNLPVWRTRRQGEVMKAEAATGQALISLEAEERRLMIRIENAYAGVKAAEEQVKLFEQKLLKDMGDEIRLAVNQYQYGKIEFFNLLDLYRTYAATQFEHLKALYQYLLALSDLEVAGEEYTD
ncbi:MAG: TolC family protein [Candidatus Aminicenantes bacterium]|nr:TolC family protein [Candidatus Aminicenantes bacterium]